MHNAYQIINSILIKTMAHIVASAIDQIISAQKLHRLRNECDFLQSTNPTNPKINELRDIITKITNVESIDKSTQFDAHKIIIREAQYKKKWNSLTQLQKIDRIKMYCAENKLGEDVYIKHQQEIGFNSKDVKYDSLVGKLIEIFNSTAFPVVKTTNDSTNQTNSNVKTTKKSHIKHAK